MLANDNPRRFFTPPPPPSKLSSSPSPVSQCRPPYPHSAGKQGLFHVVHKVPAGDSPYVRAKHVQLIDKDPSRAISLFWAAINSGDRVDSALKDMAIVMKQLNRSDEAIEAIKSFRHLSPQDSQESIDNILIELYKRSGRIEEEIEMLEYKLKNVEEGLAFNGKKTKTARSQGRKVEITIEKEYSRLLGNLAWAHMQLKNFKLAEENYRKALSLEPDKNKQCNLAICLIHMKKIVEAKFLLQSIRASSDFREMDDSCQKSLERATEMLAEFKPQMDDLKRESVSCWRKYGGERPESSFQCKKTVASPGGTPMVPLTQPRRCARRGGWSPRISRKLSFNEQYFNNSTNEKPKSDLGHWRNGSWENHNAVKTQPTLEKIHDEKWRRDSMENNKNKFTESISFASESSPAYDNQNSELKSVNNEKQLTKKSWADMVEEEDELLYMESFDTPISKCSNDENAHCNVIREIPSLKNLAENISKSLETLDLNDGGYYTQPERDFAIQTPVRLLKRRERLQVFKDITPDSPRF